MKRRIFILLLLFLTASFAMRADEAADSLSRGAVIEVDSILQSDTTVEKTFEIPSTLTDPDTLLQERTLIFEEESVEFKLEENYKYPRATKNPYKFHATELIVPGTFLAVGIAGLNIKWWKKVNENIRDDLQRNGHHPLSFDNYLQFVPAVAGYGLNLFGFKGKHNIADATILYGTTYILLAATALPMKFAIHSERPNHKNFHSFPSGHTAIAFAGAELLRREYWDVSPWIGIGGYAVASLTAFMRLYNNAHWLNDVIAGAGLGILCAEAAYWLYPVITKAFFKKRYNANVFLAPSVSTKDLGVACIITI